MKHVICDRVLRLNSLSHLGLIWAVSNIVQLSIRLLPRFRCSRRKSQSEEIFSKRKVRIVKRIVPQPIAPFRFHVIDLRKKANLLSCRVVKTATGRLVMNQLGVWRPHNQVASPTQTQAKIDVVESNRKIYFIEASDFQVNISSHHRTSSSHCRQVLG